MLERSVGLLRSPINLVGLEKLAMMRPRTIRIIATALVFMVGLTFVTGWDIVFNQFDYRGHSIVERFRLFANGGNITASNLGRPRWIHGT